MLCRVIWSTDTDVQKDSSFFNFMVNQFKKLFLGLLGMSVSTNRLTLSNISEYVNVRL